MRITKNPVEALPEPAHIRSRLAELATETNFLRALLRLLEKNRSGQRLLRLRSVQTAADLRMEGER
jgi:hypothetical protein